MYVSLKLPLRDPVHQGDGVWVVSSRTVEKKSYVVIHRTGGWRCTCLGFKFTHWCNHCTRVRQYLVANPLPLDTEQDAEQVVREFMV